MILRNSVGINRKERRKKVKKRRGFTRSTKPKR